MRKTYCIAQLDINGTELSWENSEIKAATVTEEIDRSIQSLPINKCSITVIDTDDEFDISNEDGLWNDLEYDMPLTVQEYVDGETIDCGTFYLDGWTYRDNLATFDAVDPIGYIQRRTFPGAFYLDAAASDILADIMSYGEYTDYAIDDDLASVTLTGYLPESDCREALRYLCLALGAVADCSRSSTISVSQSTRQITDYIGTDRKIYGYTQADLEEAVSEVDFSVTLYEEGTETETLYSGEIPSGGITVSFDDPIVSGSLTVEITSDTGVVYDLEYTDNSVTIDGASGTTISVTAIKYSSTASTFKKTTTVTGYADFPATKSYTCPLYNLGSIGTVMNTILTHYQLRKSLQMKFLLEEEMAGDWIGVTDRNGMTSSVYIVKQTVDLAGGFISTAECLGYAGATSAEYYADSDEGEVVAADNIII